MAGQKIASLSNQQVMEMLTLQDKMNLKVNPDWINAGYPFLRAAVIEGSECLEHYGWKWWKQQECNMDQVQMELVDSWHFILSDSIIKFRGNLNYSALDIVTHSNIKGTNGTITFDCVTHKLSDLDILRKIELIIGLAAARRVSIQLFASVMGDCNMTWADLFRQYVAKNVLNLFRQDHGYKTGSYIKIWDGREDNEHLVELMAEVSVDEADFADTLYQKLKIRYQKLGYLSELAPAIDAVAA